MATKGKNNTATKQPFPTEKIANITKEYKETNKQICKDDTQIDETLQGSGVMTWLCHDTKTYHHKLLIIRNERS